MHRRQTGLPQRWLIADTRLGDDLWRAVAALPSGSGVLILYHGLPARKRQALVRKLRRVAGRSGLRLIDEASGRAARVHDLRELRRAMLAGAELILLSPLFPTRSHPDWRPLPRMQAAALARLGQRRLVALGGMNAKRYEQIRPLGFRGWAAIDGLRT
jgi:thiamine-phosphate pyrophosphorylase